GIQSGSQRPAHSGPRPASSLLPFPDTPSASLTALPRPASPAEGLLSRPPAVSPRRETAGESRSGPPRAPPPSHTPTAAGSRNTPGHSRIHALILHFRVGRDVRPPPLRVVADEVVG